MGVDVGEGGGGIVAVGLVLFGAPFIFIMAALRLRNLLADADARAAAARAAAGQPPSVPPPLSEAAAATPG